MVEKYIAMKMFFDYELPIIVLSVMIGIWLLYGVGELLLDIFGRWFKKKNDKYFEDDKKEGES